MENSVGFYSLNVRGLQGQNKMKLVFEWCKQFKNSIIFLQETHSSKNIENLWAKYWDGSIYYSHGTTASAGVCILVPKGFDFHEKIVHTDLNGRIIILEIMLNNVKIVLGNIYAPTKNHETEQIAFLREVTDNLNDTDHFVLGGDWNTILNENLDKKGGRYEITNKMYHTMLEGMMESHDLVDCWRLYHPNKKQYSWFQHKPPIQCRLDYWLISSELLNVVDHTQIKPGFKTDHSLIKLIIKLSKLDKGRGLWKFNCSLLHDTKYVDMIRELIIIENNNTQDVIDKGFKWDYIKMRIRSETILYSSTKKKLEQKHEEDLKCQLEKLHHAYSDNPSEELYENLTSVENDIEKLIYKKMQGSMLRSKCDWVELGEKNSKFFLNLERKNSDSKLICQLEKNETVLQSQQEISYEIEDYYSTLYSEIPIREDLLNDLNLDIPKLDESDLALTEGLITEKECLNALKDMDNGKNPGLDGFPADFYKFFWLNIKELVLSSLNYAFTSEKMSKDQRIGIITLIPQKDKIRTILKNWRPISLLTVDYKLIAKSLAIRLEKILPKIISQSQYAYVKNRYIGENVRAVSDINDYLKQNNHSGIIMQIDFEKAFDSVNWKFMETTLNKYGFGESFKKWVKLMYTDISSAVLNNGHLTKFFQIKRGVRQGCPLSAILFILIVELLAQLLNNRKDIRGVTIQNKELKILQFADDTNIILEIKEHIPKVLKLLKFFQKMSGLKTNVEKTVVYHIGCYQESQTAGRTYGLRWETNNISVLGVTLSDDENENYTINFQKRIQSIETLTRIWAQRRLSLKGKITIINALLLPKLLYPATNLCVPNRVYGEVDKLLFNFLWDNKPAKVKRSTIIRQISKGGLKMPEFSTKVKSWKCLWVKRADLSLNNSVWMTIIDAFLPKETPFQLLLKCRLNSENIANLNNLPAFYKEILKAWADIKNCSPVDTYKDVLSESIWLNKFVTIEAKSVLWKRWLNRGIKFIQDLLNDQNSFRTPAQFYSDFNLHTNFLEVLQIKQAMPGQWRKCLHDGNYEKEEIDTNIVIKLGSKSKSIRKIKSKDLYWKLIENRADALEKPACQHKWEKELHVPPENFELIYRLPFTCCKYTKLQSFQYKIINRVVACNYWLFRTKIKSSGKCSFCEHIDSIQHFFIHCQKTLLFWKMLYKWWNNLEVPKIPDVHAIDILFGYPDENINYIKVFNYILLIAKYHIYKQKMNALQPFFPSMLIELKNQLFIDENISLKNGCHAQFTTDFDFVYNAL